MRKVTIIGAGALGSHVAMLLRNEAALKLIDFDRVEQKNVLAQFHGKQSIGRNKAEALKQTMQLLWNVKAIAVPHRLTVDNVEQLLGDADLLIDCLDNGSSRRLVQEFTRDLQAREGPFGDGYAHDCVHGALAADGQFGQVVWNEQFKIDDEDIAGAATCEGGEHLPFIVTVASYLARSAQIWLSTGKQVGWSISPAGALRL